MQAEVDEPIFLTERVLSEERQDQRDKVLLDKRTVRGKIFHKLANEMKMEPDAIVEEVRLFAQSHEIPEKAKLLSLFGTLIARDSTLDEGSLEGLLRSRGVTWADLQGLPLFGQLQVITLALQERIYNLGSKEIKGEDWNNLTFKARIVRAGTYLFQPTSDHFSPEQQPWKEYVATLPINTTRYGCRPEVTVAEGMQDNAYLWADTAFEFANVIREIAPLASDSGQPISTVEYALTKKTKRHQFDIDGKIPILFYKKDQQGKMQGVLVTVSKDDTREDFANRLTLKLKNNEWESAENFDTALIAVDTNTDRMLFDKEDIHDGFDAVRLRHPAFVLSWARNSQNRHELQITTDHLVADGMLTNAIINAPTETTKGIKGLRNRLFSISTYTDTKKLTHVEGVKVENYNSVCIGEINTNLNPPAELCAWSTMFAYQTLIETMQEEGIKPWQNLTRSMGINLTFSKDELASLRVGGSGLEDPSYYDASERARKYCHVIPMLNALSKFKTDKDIAEENDDFDSVTQVERALATVTRSSIPDSFAKGLNEIVRHNGMESVRAVLAFPPTCIIEDISNSTQHETVVGRDLPNIVIQRGTHMMRFILSVDQTSRFISQTELPELTKTMTIYMTELMQIAKDGAYSEDQSLVELNEKLDECRNRLKQSFKDSIGAHKKQKQ